MREDSATQHVIGRAGATWQSARYLVSAVEKTWEISSKQGFCPKEIKFQLRLAATHTFQQAKTVFINPSLFIAAFRMFT